MRSPFNMTVSKLYGLSPLKENDKVGKYHYTKYKKKKPKTYTTQEKIDLGLDVGAIINPAFDFLHAGSKAKEGKYGEAALYAGFGLIPGTAKPLVEGTKKVLSKFKNLFTKSKTLNFGGGDIPKSLTASEVTKHNVNINKYGQGDPNILPTPKTTSEALKITENATKDIGKLGKRMDDAGYSIGHLDPKKSVQKIGQADSGQTIYEVTYPGGEKLRFWESTSKGKKPVRLSPRNAHLNSESSKGYFGVLPGHMDRSKLPKGGSDSWFVKSQGWERGYGSDIIEDTGIWLQSLKKAGQI